MTDDTGKTLAGGCLCGDVRYNARGVETHHHACHCGMCRRWSGGPLFAAQVATLSFESTRSVQRYASSDWAERGFCTTCGSGLFYYLKPADRYFVPVGTFDDGDAFELSVELCIDRKKGNYGFTGDLPGLTEQQVFEQGEAAD